MPDILRRIRDFLLAEDCPVNFYSWPWRTRSPMERLRCIASRNRFGHHSWWLRRALEAASVAVWPARLVYLTWHFTGKFGREVASDTGKSILSQWLEQLETGFTGFQSSRAYYQYSLYRDDRRSSAVAYLHNRERTSLCAQIDGHVTSGQIQDKLLFAKACESAGLPAVPVLAIVDAGRLRNLDHPGCSDEFVAGSLPEYDLFIKPVSSSRGQNVSRWQYLGPGRYRNSDGTVCSANEIGRQNRPGGPYLVQPCLRNHSDIANLSTGSLATVRIVSGRYPDGLVEIIAATFKMPRGQSLTDNHGFSCPVDIKSGTLGPGGRYRPVDQQFDWHPTTRAAIADRVLPDWQQAIQLVMRAHAVFNEHAFLGWDVALTPEGPVLLEANVGWDVVTVQKPQGIPLGCTSFVDICEEWLRRVA